VYPKKAKIVLKEFSCHERCFEGNFEMLFDNKKQQNFLLTVLPKPYFFFPFDQGDKLALVSHVA